MGTETWKELMMMMDGGGGVIKVGGIDGYVMETSHNRRIASLALWNMKK